MKQSKQTQTTLPRAARLAVMAVFFINGAVLANWFARIPAVQDKLDLSTGQLGIALTGMAIGALISMPISGWLIARLGSRPVTRVTAVVYCAALILPAIAPGMPTLMLSLALLGGINGAMDVAMNSQAVAIEKHYRRPVMSAFHGLWNVGGMVGAAIGGVIASQEVDLAVHFTGAAVVLSIAAVIVSRWLLPAAEDAGSQGPAFARPSRAILGLGIVTFCGMMAEGAISDWSAVYLRGTLDTGPGLAAAGYAAFSFAMAVGRLVGDRLNQRIGPVALVRLAGILAAVGMWIALSAGGPYMAIAGFACIGAGVSIIVPIAFSAAGRTPGMAPGPAIAAVATTGYSGFLIGPPLIGLTGDILSLRSALGIVVVLGVMITALAYTVQPAKASEETVHSQAVVASK